MDSASHEPAVAAARRSPLWLSPFVAGAALLAGLALLGELSYRWAAELVERAAWHRLEAVATLKESLVQAWIEDTRDDIRIWSTSEEFLGPLQSLHAGEGEHPDPRGRLSEYLRTLARTSHYVSITVRDPLTGQSQWSTQDSPDLPEQRARAVAAAVAAADLPSWAPQLDKAAANDGGVASLGLEFYAVVRQPASGVRSVLQVEVDPRHDLFRVIEQWPGDSETGELLLVQAQAEQGDGLVVLNDSRAGAKPAALRRLPAKTPERLGTQIIERGRAGFVRGQDDRGRRVLAYALPVAATPWLLLAKIDEAEVFSELNRIFGLSFALGAGLLAAAAWWAAQHRRHLSLERTLQAERTAQAERVAELSRRVVSAQEEERRRLAVELHDRTAANLTVIQLNLKSIAGLLPQAGEEDRQLLAETGHLLADTVVSIRDFCADLRPAILDYAGLVEALSFSLTQLGRRTGIAVEFDHQAYGGVADKEVESVLYRIAQEALLNCAKHAQATKVRLSLSGAGQRVALAVEDDGVGFDPLRVGRSGRDTGQGLLNMRERAAFAGGRLEVDSRPGAGARIRFETA